MGSSDQSATEAPPPAEPAVEAAEALSELASKLKANVSPARWEAIVARARYRAEVLDKVAELHAGGLSKRKALAQAAGIHWSTFRNWERSAVGRTGAPWERQLDARVPPKVVGTPPEVRSAAIGLRLARPKITAQEARALLVKQFGEDRGGISAATLGRIWRSEGLVGRRRRGDDGGGNGDSNGDSNGGDAGGGNGGDASNGGGGMSQTEEVTSLSGGGVMALLGAAMAALGVTDTLGEAIVNAAKQAIADQDEVAPLPDSLAEAETHRDAAGRLTGAYNKAARGTDAMDPRFASDATKRRYRDLSTLRVANSRAETMGAKLLVMGLSPLITERRGFDGLRNQSGSWIEATGLFPYQGTTLSKALAEMALANVNAALWAAYGKLWASTTRRWTTADGTERWLQCVLYVDGTQDPYWTRHFAESGKVSRVNRVMPCIARVVITGGPGVPLLVETTVGTAPLADRLERLLDQLEAAIGEGELGRFTIIDGEAGTLPTMTMLARRPNRVFITVIKGGTAKAITRKDEGEFVRFRDNDLIRPVTIEFTSREPAGTQATAAAPREVITLRGVEMIREGSRNPTTTLFVTNGSEEEISFEEIPTIYLSRWPNQEQRFRESRHGIGLERTHGYGGEYVEHGALQTKRDKAAAALERRDKQLANAQEVEKRSIASWKAAKRGQKGQARAAMKLAQSAVKRAQRAVTRAKKDKSKLESMPRLIYRRDTTRDSIATCAKLTAFMLIEYVLREFFGGLKMQPRSFIERFVQLPVVIRSSKRRRLYQIQANPRDPKGNALLRDACAVVNARNIRDGDRLLRFEVVDDGVG